MFPVYLSCYKSDSLFVKGSKNVWNELNVVKILSQIKQYERYVVSTKRDWFKALRGMLERTQRNHLSLIHI